MSFGYSVGDFLAVLQLANNIQKRFVDVPTRVPNKPNVLANLSNLPNQTKPNVAVRRFDKPNLKPE
jgi:hypothetical protein